MKKEIQDALRKQSKVHTQPAKPIERKAPPAAETKTGQKATTPAKGKGTKE